MATSNCLATNILQNALFCVQQKKETLTGLKRLEDEKMTTEQHLCVNFPFNLCFIDHDLRRHSSK